MLFLCITEGFGSRSDGGRRPFGSGFQRDDYRSSGDHYAGRDRYGERERDRYGDREDKFERRDERREDRGENISVTSWVWASRFSLICFYFINAFLFIGMWFTLV